MIFGINLANSPVEDVFACCLKYLLLWYNQICINQQYQGLKNEPLFMSILGR